MLTAAVNRGVENALVIGDLPFMSYQVSDAEAVRNAGRLIKEGGADVVKLEGAGPSLERVRALVAAGIRVMGHIGLTPQTATTLGGHKAQGRQADAARRLFLDAIALETAGCFALVLEAVPAPVATTISRPAHDPHHRHRRPGPAPTARCWCCTTCSASRATAASRASSSATPRSAS